MRYLSMTGRFMLRSIYLPIYLTSNFVRIWMSSSNRRHHCPWTIHSFPILSICCCYGVSLLRGKLLPSSVWHSVVFLSSTHDNDCLPKLLVGHQKDKSFVLFWQIATILSSLSPINSTHAKLLPEVREDNPKDLFSTFWFCHSPFFPSLFLNPTHNYDYIVAPTHATLAYIMHQKRKRLCSSY